MERELTLTERIIIWADRYIARARGTRMDLPHVCRFDSAEGYLLCNGDPVLKCACGKVMRFSRRIGPV